MMVSYSILGNLLKNGSSKRLLEDLAQNSNSQKKFVEPIVKGWKQGNREYGDIVNSIQSYTKELGGGEKNLDDVVRMLYDGSRLKPYSFNDVDSFKASLGKKLYHGTDTDFKHFNLSNFGKTDQGFLGRGVYLTGDRLNAKQYGDNVIEAYAPMSNPYTLEDAYFFGGFTPGKITDDLGIENYGNAAGFTQAMKDRGYDGVIVNEIANDMGKINPMKEVVAFNPRKVYTDTYLDEMYSLLR